MYYINGTMQLHSLNWVFVSTVEPGLIALGTSTVSRIHGVAGFTRFEVGDGTCDMRLIICMLEAATVNMTSLRDGGDETHLVTDIAIDHIPAMPCSDMNDADSICQFSV